MGAVTIEAGKFYRNRLGEKIGPMRMDGDYDDTFSSMRIGDAGWHYATDGSLPGLPKGDERELVAEWTDLRLEVGKSYRRRDGSQAIIKEYDAKDNTYREDDEGYWYYPNGIVWGLKLSHKDIVAEWTEPLSLEIGKVYRSRKGERVEIVHFDHVKGWFRDKASWWYLPDGRFQGLSAEADPDYPRHLIALWEEQPPAVPPAFVSMARLEAESLRAAAIEGRAQVMEAMALGLARRAILGAIKTRVAR